MELQKLPFEEQAQILALALAENLNKNVIATNSVSNEIEKDLGMELINKTSKHNVIVKVNEDQHIVYAWASVAEVNGEPYHDAQGDNISPQDLEKAANDFVLDVRKAGEMHDRTEGIGQLVASMVFTSEIQKALGINLGKVGWLTGWKVTDPEVWKKIKAGEYGAMSIHGKGNREEL